MTEVDEIVASHGEIDTSEYSAAPSKTGEEENIDNLIESCWLDVSKPIKEDIYLLRQNGIGFSPLGDIQALRGMEGNGKSFLFTMYMAAVLNGRYGTLTCDIADAKVLLIDTEQHENNILKTAARVHKMVGWNVGQPNPRFKVMTLREVDDIEYIQKMVEKAILDFLPTVVFLDGIVDTVKSKNDETDSKQWIRKLMRLSSTKNMCIWNVLHVNYGSDKMSGHLGTELAHKASDVMSCQKDKKTGIVTFTVEQVKARNRDIDDLTFRIVDVPDGSGGKLGIPEITTIVNHDKDTPTNRGERDELMKEILGNGPLCKSRILEGIMSKRFMSGADIPKDKGKLWIEQAIQWGIIKENTKDHKWEYVGLNAKPLEDVPEEDPIPFD